MAARTAWVAAGCGANGSGGGRGLGVLSGDNGGGGGGGGCGWRVWLMCVLEAVWWWGGGQQIRTVGVFLGHVITGEVQRRGASVYRSLVTPRGSSIVFKVETGKLRGCAGAHGARGVFGYREEGEWGGE